MEERLKAMVQQYKSIESQRDNLLSDLKRLAGETIDRVERSKDSAREFDADHHFATAKREAKKVLNPNADFEPTVRKPDFAGTCVCGVKPAGVWRRAETSKILFRRHSVTLGTMPPLAC